MTSVIDPANRRLNSLKYVLQRQEELSKAIKQVQNLNSEQESALKLKPLANLFEQRSTAYTRWLELDKRLKTAQVMAENNRVIAQNQLNEKNIIIDQQNKTYQPSENKQEDIQTQQNVEESLLNMKTDWLLQINTEIEQIQAKNQMNLYLKQKARTSKEDAQPILHRCKNRDFLQRMIPTVYTSFIAYFEEIHRELIKDIIRDEVRRLNLKEMKARETENVDQEKFKSIPLELIPILTTLDNYQNTNDYYESE